MSRLMEAENLGRCCIGPYRSELQEGQLYEILRASRPGLTPYVGSKGGYAILLNARVDHLADRSVDRNLRRIE